MSTLLIIILVLVIVSIVLGIAWFLFVAKFMASIFKEVKGSGTPRFPERFGPRRRL
jgi:flagellar basal body-associated protein FliL